MKDTAGRTHSLVVGGTRGIGRSVVSTFANEGHLVSVIGRRPPTENDRHKTDVHYWTLDLLDREHLYEACDELVSLQGPIRNLVFLQRYRDRGDDWTGEFETSLTATKDLIEFILQRFSGSGDNAIVIVNSAASHLVHDEQPVSYHVMKAAQIQMVRYYATTLGPKGIRVNSVSPAIVLKEEAKPFYMQNESLQDLYKRITPLGRMGSTEEIANVIEFLCSPKASFITGQDITVDGGLSLQSQATLARKLTSLDHLNIARQTGQDAQ